MRSFVDNVQHQLTPARERQGKGRLSAATAALLASAQETPRRGTHPTAAAAVVTDAMRKAMSANPAAAVAVVASAAPAAPVSCAWRF